MEEDWGEVYPSEQSEERPENRRRHIRFELNVPLFAELSLWRIKGVEMKSRTQRVLVNDISAGGCQFRTHLQIPPREDVEWLLKLQFGKYKTQLKAIIVRAFEDEGLQVYGIRWTMTGLEYQAFHYRLNEYIYSSMVSSPHIQTLYRKIAERSSDGQFQRLDVSS
jgi:hypothetical protein